MGNTFWLASSIYDFIYRRENSDLENLNDFLKITLLDSSQRIETRPSDSKTLSLILNIKVIKNGKRKKAMYLLNPPNASLILHW